MRHLLLATAVLAAGAFAAFAHAHLTTAAPAPGATVAAPPTEVAITFDEEVEPKFSTIAVTDAHGARVDTGPAHLTGGDELHLAVPLKPLAAGAYKVVWHALSTDGHKTKGSFAFTLAP